jgi:hypothetical protein
MTLRQEGSIEKGGEGRVAGTDGRGAKAEDEGGKDIGVCRRNDSILPPHPPKFLATRAKVPQFRRETLGIGHGVQVG